MALGLRTVHKRWTGHCPPNCSRGLGAGGRASRHQLASARRFWKETREEHLQFWALGSEEPACRGRSKEAGVWVGGEAQGPEISQDQTGGGPLRAQDSRFTIPETGLQVGLSLIEKNKIKQKAMTRLACRGCGESCPEEAREEREKGGTTLKALKGDGRGPLKRRAGASDPKRRDTLGNTDPWGPDRLAWELLGAPGFWVLTAGLRGEQGQGRC